MPLMLFVEARVVAAQEELGELRQVVETIAQRRQLDRNDVEAKEEVAAERAVLDRALEVDVGRRDQAERRLDRLGAADPFDLAFLNGAQQLGLQVEPQVADLVEEQRAAAGQLELADALLHGAGERAPLVAKERALDEVARNGGQVDGDERPIRAPGRAIATDARWIMRASSSLPVPLSPRMSTVAESGPTLCTTSITSCIARLGPDDELAVADVLHFVAQRDQPPIQILPLRGVRHRGPQACRGRYLCSRK